jgi:hypothetical protein
MGFIKREEFDQLRAEFNEFKRSAKVSSVKTTPTTPKKSAPKKATVKKSTTQKKRKS